MIKKKKFEIIYAPAKKNNYIVILAIGQKHYSEWKKYSLPLLLRIVKTIKLVF